MDSLLSGLFFVVPLAILGFLAAVWFGVYVLAPRISRAFDHAETADEEPGERPD
jgi:hypothetical protein